MLEESWQFRGLRRRGRAFGFEREIGKRKMGLEYDSDYGRERDFVHVFERVRSRLGDYGYENEKTKSLDSSFEYIMKLKPESSVQAVTTPLPEWIQNFLSSQLLLQVSRRLSPHLHFLRSQLFPEYRQSLDEIFCV